MISSDKARAFIQQHDKIAISKDQFANFSRPYQVLGLIISNQWEDGYANYAMLKAYEGGFGTDNTINPWTNAEGLRLATLLFGSGIGSFVAKIWDILTTLPYQESYSRRPFRLRPELCYTQTRLNTLKSMYYGGASGFNSMTILDQLQYDVYQHVPDIGLFYASVFTEDQAKYYPILEEIFLGEHHIGGVSRELIRGLLLTEYDAYHLLVEKLLLAAQQQEGLRQTILETLDFTSVKALKRFLKVILDHNLTRFSSVVRAVDTWFGFGWDAPKANTIQRTLELALNYFENPNAIELAINSQDNLELYVALWVKAIADVDAANLLALNVVFDDKSLLISKLVSLFFVQETERTHSDLIQYAEQHVGEDIELDYWMLVNFPSHELSDNLFNKLVESASKLPTAGKEFVGRGFSWKNYTIKPEYFFDAIIRDAQPHHFVLMAQDLAGIPSNSRESLMRKLFPDHYAYSWSHRYDSSPDRKNLDLPAESWQRQVVRQAISDRNTAVSATGMSLMNAMDLYAEDITALESLLARKGKDQRKLAIQLLLKQRDQVLEASLSRLLLSTNIDQRLAGLEILVLLAEKKEWSDYVQKQVTAYSNRKIGKNESVFLDQLNKESAKPDYGFSNGFGAIDYGNLTEMRLPQSQFTRPKKRLISFSKKREFLFEDLINVKKTIQAINGLYALFDQHRKHEYGYEGYQGSLETTLLEISLQGMKRLGQEATAEQHLENLPLADVWKGWYNQAALNDFEIQAVMRYIYNHYNDYQQYKELKSFKELYIPTFAGINFGQGEYYYSSDSEKIVHILQQLMEVHSDRVVWAAYKLDILEDSLHHFPEELKTHNFADNQHYCHYEVYWTDFVTNMLYTISVSDFAFYSTEQLLRLYQMHLFVIGQQLAEGKAVSTIQQIIPYLSAALNPEKPVNLDFPAIELLLELFQRGKINKDDLLFLSLISKDLFFILDGGQNYNVQQLKSYTIPKINETLKKNLLTVELQRGDIPTEASPFIEKMQKVEGIDYFFEVLQRMGKENFDRGYSYGINLSKKYTFSRILKRGRPSAEEAYAAFTAALKASNVDKKRLVEVSCYATQWADWVGDYLQIPSLSEAVWWFLAHTTDYMDAEKETVLSRYSTVPKNDFQKGAIDIEWFQRVYANLGKANWKLVHESAKYLSDGMGYRRVKIYSSVLLGETKITETLKRITEKRDKDYVMALGLIPISKNNAAGDLLKRYNVLQNFLNESKQFGAQRQESEKNAVEIGMDNLARNAGFEDSVRFVWAMEAKATQQILKEALVTIDDVDIRLTVDEEGKAELLVNRNGKALKSIPDKLKKNKAIESLKDGKAYLSKQFSRTKQALENSMLRRDRYSPSELRQIMEHPIVRAMLSKLVLYKPDTQQTGFWSDAGLVDSEGKLAPIKDSDQLLIAHPFHLYDTAQWDLYQRYLFKHTIQQPFKQVFRELYVPTADELEQRTRSTRYQGQQIQPKKTIALLRGRGWTVSYEEGLQKVFHKEGYLVTMFAMADWYSPSDVEAPTLELICFYGLRDRELLPITDIDPVVFSEVMRDMDLVVSVAHVGEVDPEASHSSMQMRAALAKESATLFGLENVEVKERHVLVRGTLAEYSIHLGSGMVAIAGRQLALIPVHSQHRGRVFLPFVDDDPKSAEIISKMRYLAQDNKIKDPTVLDQINR
ncbi:DUF4132 domain-containing protein [Sphingobacterium deserti]|uniref:DUF4132 domain-containing protein n=1 Tax=Sphingobacterium deserti TaxID=1229276 RepID=A0A0B8T1M8_9SPHI|nr:DUF4132 domain-containing protein [Sphingobacterium deserti]KGE12578.1 hypothetical protein DI53_3618 [Sphingobacterium deserti]